MKNQNYRRNVNIVAIISSGAFAGGNLFIGLSVGIYWLSLPSLEFVASFAPMFQHFLYTIMPLFLMTMMSLVLSAKLDWNIPEVKHYWRIAIGLFVATSLMTVFYHVPENLRLLANNYNEQQAHAALTYWLSGHIPRVFLTLGTAYFVVRAVLATTKR